MKIFKPIILLILILIGYGYNVSAQVYPVQVTTTLVPPYSLSLSDYGNPVDNRINANIYMADLTQINYAAKIRLVITGNNLLIRTKPGNEIGPIYLNGGSTLILTSADLSSLFDVNKVDFLNGFSYADYIKIGGLPEGAYQFQFEILDYNLGKKVSDINSGYAVGWLIRNDPPIINKPEDRITIVPTMPQNIFFQWTPRHTGSPNSAFTVVYDIEMVEIYPADRNPNDAMLTSAPIFQATVTTTSYNYTIADPNLFENRWYAFRVRARDLLGRDLFKNMGYSQVHSFYYGKGCPIVQNIKTTSLDESSLIVTWDDDPMQSKYIIEYRTIAPKTSSWNSKTIYMPTATITGLTPGSTYEIRLQSDCNSNQSEYSPVVTWTSIGSGNGCTSPTDDHFYAYQSMDGNVTLAWQYQEWATLYTVRYREEGTIEWKEKSVKTPEVVLTDLNLSKKYEYQIQYTCADGKNTLGLIGKFSIYPYTPDGTPDGDCYAPFDITHELSGTDAAIIKWITEGNTNGYQVIYKIKDKMPESWDTVTVSKEKATLKSLMTDTIYYYKVRSICRLGGYSKASQIFELNTKFDKGSKTCPPLLSTEDKGISDTEVLLKWAPLPENTGFLVNYRKKGTTAWMEIQTQKTSYLAEWLSPSTIYEYKIASFCGTKKSDFTAIDTVKTLVVDDGYVCGKNNYFKIGSLIPGTLLVNDPFKAAGFNMAVKSIVSTGPYNGEATAKIPYLKNSNFIFTMDRVMVNNMGEMYQGRLIMKAIHVQVISSDLANKISSFIDKLDEGLDKADQYVAMAEEIGTILNETIAAAEEPIDWSMYANWTPQQLFEEGKKLAAQGQALLDKKDPKDLPDGVRLIKKSVALITRAAELAKELALDLKGIFTTQLSKIKDSLNTEQNKRNSKITLYDMIDNYNGFSQKNIVGGTETENPDLIFINDETGISMEDFENMPETRDIAVAYKNERNDLMMKIYLESIVEKIEFILANPAELVKLIDQAKDEITSLDLNKIDPKTTTPDSIKNAIIDFIDEKIQQ